MTASHEKQFVLGIDFGTDSVRAIVVDSLDGSIIGIGSCKYRRWADGKYCSGIENRFRQHPLDYMQSLEEAVRTAIRSAPRARASDIKALCIDTTGSTPCLADRFGMPLALLDSYRENPDAMFILWKDHTAIKHAKYINNTIVNKANEDYSTYCGGVYSAEWYWAKAFMLCTGNPDLVAAAATFVEHCDWMVALLTGVSNHIDIKRSRCAAGHKAMWHASWNGFPPEDFLATLHPELGRLRRSLPVETITAGQNLGQICQEWADRLGLSRSTIVASGALDAHAGAIGGNVAPGTLLKIMGTSTCDILVANKSETEHLVPGICGQVDGSVLPDMIGYEAGQSAFGDIFAWFAHILSWPYRNPSIKIDAHSSNVSGNQRASPEDLEAQLLRALESEAEKLEAGHTHLVALDWLNGRRSPDADQNLTGMISGISLGTDPPALYRALVEAAAFGSRAIVERLRAHKIVIEKIIALGGVARKSNLVMSILSNVLDMPIDVVGSDECCALGSAICAATAAGIYPNMAAAQKAMCATIEKQFVPDPSKTKALDKQYALYKKLGNYSQSVADGELLDKTFSALGIKNIREIP